MLSALRSNSLRSAIRLAVGGDDSGAIETFVDGRLARLDPVPRLLLRIGECIAAIPEVGTRLPGGRQYADVVASLATAYSMEKAEEAP